MHLLDKTTYNFLPDGTQTLLSKYHYNEQSALVLDAMSYSPGVSFLTVDIKVPEEGNPRILELGGVSSQLVAYPEGDN